jgi:hypothetical protein
VGQRATSRPHLRRAAARLAGDDGLALACAAIDLISAGEPPAGWPIAELIALLETPTGARDRQVERLLVVLRRIEADLPMEHDLLDEEAA